MAVLIRVIRPIAMLAIVSLAACIHRDPVPPVIGQCANDALTNFDDLLILAPHPDDEVLGFAGLASTFTSLGKSVRTVVVTDGDAYCVACALWTTGSVTGRGCGPAELTNFDTRAVDSLAEVRRLDSAAAAERLDLETPEFLGYPDTGLAAARRNFKAGNSSKRLRRSDFSGCDNCLTCELGYGEGPSTRLSADTLTASLDEILGETSKGTLIATTHWLDGHGDHAALGAFVEDRLVALRLDRSVAFAVIHANSPNGFPYADCWYPGPPTPECSCFDDERADADPEWLVSLRRHRERLEWPQELPDDVDYGDASQLCLAETVKRSKPAAIDAFKTQLGTVGKTAGVLPESRQGLLDCSAYLRSFGRTTEVFVVKPLEGS